MVELSLAVFPVMHFPGAPGRFSTKTVRPVARPRKSSARNRVPLQGHPDPGSLDLSPARPFASEEKTEEHGSHEKDQESQSLGFMVSF